MTFAAASLAEYLEMQQDEVVLLCLPLSFDYGLYQLLLTILVGGTLVLEKGFAFPGKVVQLLESEGVTGLPGVPTLFGVLLGLRGLEARELPALRYLSNTGAALSVTTIAGLRETFPKARIYSMYGLTECKRVSYLPPHLIDVKPALRRHRDPRHRGVGRGRRGQRVRPRRGRRADDARPARHAGLLERRRGDRQAPPPRPLAVGARAA